MKKLKIILNEKLKSFEQDFSSELLGDLILLSGVNGSGKTQLMKIIHGSNYDRRNPEQKLNRKIILDSIEIEAHEVLYKSFRDYSHITDITLSSITSRIKIREELWRWYTQYRLDYNRSAELKDFKNSCELIRDILITKFGDDNFRNIKIAEDDFHTLIPPGFVLYKDDIFSDKIGDIFFNYISQIHHRKVKAYDSKQIIDESHFGIAPWTELNNLFKELKFDYRFKDNYHRTDADMINEQPAIYSIDHNGKIDNGSKRSASDLSDGEKAIISLTFAALSNEKIKPKILLLDEYDATLNPSLTNAFFAVLKKFFIDKGVQVIISTHSSSTLALAPEYARFYEIYKPKSNRDRVLEVSRDAYEDMRIANARFYYVIENQESRYDEIKKMHDEQNTLIAKLEQQIKDSAKNILILCEGKTDAMHLKKAQQKLNITDLDIEFIDLLNIEGWGDTQLKNALSKYALLPNTNKRIIGIFDRDVEGTIKEIGNYKDYGNNVHAFCIPVPQSRLSYKNISLEFYYSDNEIKKEKDGKRLCFDNEIHEMVNKSIKRTEIKKLDTPDHSKENEKKIFDENIGDEKWLHSKSAFAGLVLRDEDFAKDFDFQNFNLIFDKIRDIRSNDGS